MTLALVSIFGFMLEEYYMLPICVCVCQILLTPLLLLGIFSVLYWRWTDDLRPSMRYMYLQQSEYQVIQNEHALAGIATIFIASLF